MAQPILRPRNDWYTERYEGFCRTYITGINALGLGNVSKLEALSRMSQNFAADQVHLTYESSRVYVNCLLYHADNLFTAEVIDLEEGTSKKPDRLGWKGDVRQQEVDFEKNVRSLDKKLEELNRDMFRRRFQDSLVMARLREDLDTVSNTNKEDKIMISGLTSTIPRPPGRDEARKWLKDIVSKVLDSIEEGCSADIIFVSQGRSNNRNIPLAEVRMKSREQAVRIRKTFAQKKKSGKDYGKIYLSNCVTLATRVRIEILRAMAKKFDSDREKMFVMGYYSRPVLHVKRNESENGGMWLSFSDALLRYGSGLVESDLEEASKKAGMAFKGQLEQNFVGLHDKPEKNTNDRVTKLIGEASCGTPKKRMRVNDD
jgi:hypothetical protein